MKRKGILTAAILLIIAGGFFGVMLRLNIKENVTAIRIDYIENYLASSMEIDKEVTIEDENEIHSLIDKINDSWLWQVPGKSEKSWNVSGNEKMGYLRISIGGLSENHILGIYEDGTVILDDKEYKSLFSKKEGTNLYQDILNNLIL